MSISLNQLLIEKSFLRVYGQEITDFSPGKDFGIPSTRGAVGQFARIRAFSYGNRCVELPIPLIMIVIGQGDQPDPNDSCALPNEMMWSVLPDEPTVVASFDKRTIAEALDEAHTKGIDGGVTIENPRFENGSICGTAHAWYDIEVFGQHIKDDKRIDFCIPLEGCHTIYDFGIGSIEACVSAAPNGVKLCLKACVGKWGLSQCWDVCTFIGISKTSNSSSPRGERCQCND